MNINIIIALIVVFVVLKFLSIKGRLSRKKFEEIKGENPVVVDVRSKSEYNSGHIEGAYNIPHDEIIKGIIKLKIKKDRVVILYCASGTRSRYALNALKSQGFNRAYNGGAYSYLGKIIGG